MDKIKGLLEKIGASEELANQLCEELERYDKQIQEKYEEAYQTKLAQAKKICVEEVNKHKVDLARKVRVFLEGKSGQIEQRLDQQRAIEEGKADGKLRRIREITEDIEVADNAELQALKKKLQKLETRNVQLTEEKKKALVAANRANKIALEVLERNNKKSIAEGEEKKPVVESKEEPKPEQKVEETKEKQKALKEEVTKTKKKVAKPKTTRRTIVENQKPAKKKPINGGFDADKDILDIANNIE